MNLHEVLPVARFVSQRTCNVQNSTCTDKSVQVLFFFLLLFSLRLLRTELKKDHLLIKQTLGCKGHSFTSSVASGMKMGTISSFWRAVYLGASGSITYETKIRSMKRMLRTLKNKSQKLKTFLLRAQILSHSMWTFAFDEPWWREKKIYIT